MGGQAESQATAAAVGTHTGSPNLALRTLKNAAFGAAEFIWPILIALLATPYIVRSLGSALYGLFSIIAVTIGFFGFLDLGVGSAATRQIAARHARGDHEGINAVISTVLVFYLTVGLVGTLALVALTGTLVSRWLAVPAESIDLARTAFYISAPGLMVSLVLGMFGSIPRALQRYEIASTAVVTLNTLITIAAVVALALGRGLVAIVVAGLVLNAAAIPIMFGISKRLLPGLRVRLTIDRKLFKELLTFGSAFMLSSVGVALLYQADKLLIGSVLGMAAVTYYVIPGNLAQRIQGLTAAATGIVFPVSSALFESGEHHTLRNLYTEGSRLSYLLVVAIAVPLAVFADRFLLYWMGTDVASRSSLAMVFLVATYAIMASSSIPWGIANGSGRARINAFFTLAIAGLDIGLFFILIRPWGIAGAAAAYLISAAVGVPTLIWYIERRVLGLSGFRFLRNFWRVGIAGAAQAGVALLLRLLAVNLWVTMALMVISAFVLPLAYWLFGFAQEGDRRLLSLLWTRVARKNPPSPTPEA